MINNYHKKNGSIVTRFSSHLSIANIFGVNVRGLSLFRKLLLMMFCASTVFVSASSAQSNSKQANVDKSESQITLNLKVV